MSTLEQFIKMRDGISNPINKATQAVNKLYLAEEQMANSTLKAEQSMENMANGIKNNIAGINKTNFCLILLHLLSISTRETGTVGIAQELVAEGDVVIDAIIHI